MVEKQRAIAAIVAQDPNIRSFMSSVGATNSRPTTNTGSLNMILKPRDERELSADQIIQQLRPKLAAVPGIRVHAEPAGDPYRRPGRFPRNTNTPCKAPISTSCTNGPTYLSTRFAHCPVSSTLPATSTTRARSLPWKLTGKRSPHGLSFAQVEDALQSAFSSPDLDHLRGIEQLPGHSGSRTRLPDRSVDALAHLRTSFETGTRLNAPDSNGKLIPLDTVVNTTRKTQAMTVSHRGATSLGDDFVPTSCPVPRSATQSFASRGWSRKSAYPPRWAPACRVRHRHFSPRLKAWACCSSSPCWSSLHRARHPLRVSSTR